MASEEMVASNSPTGLPYGSENETGHNDIYGVPLAAKIAVPISVFLLATTITVILCVRYVTCCRGKEKRRKGREEIEMQTVYPVVEIVDRPVTLVPDPNMREMTRLNEPRQHHDRSTHGCRSYCCTHGTHVVQCHGIVNDVAEVDVRGEHVYGRISRCGKDGQWTAGYITMSSPGAFRSSPKPTCLCNNRYITARPDSRIPIHVCLPFARSDLTREVNGVEEDKHQEIIPAKDVVEPAYEVLDKYRKRTSKSKRSRSYRDFHPKKVRQNYLYDSLPLLPVQMSVMDIPIGPFISKAKPEPTLSETMNHIEKQESFENMFEGAWWHNNSEDETDAVNGEAPVLPYRTSTLQFCNNLPAQRPASYVTMNQLSKRPSCHRDGSMGNKALTASSRSLDSSYFRHGQTMKLIGFHTAVGDEDDDVVLPPPAPCIKKHDYVNARTALSN